jgi:hypothetical protein
MIQCRGVADFLDGFVQKDEKIALMLEGVCVFVVVVVLDMQ